MYKYEHPHDKHRQIYPCHYVLFLYFIVYYLNLIRTLIVNLLSPTIKDWLFLLACHFVFIFIFYDLEMHFAANELWVAGTLQPNPS